MNNENRQFDFLDILNILSFYIGWRNLIENEMQSAYNDVHAANSEQEQHLLAALDKRFEQQNKILEEILSILNKMT